MVIDFYVPLSSRIINQIVSGKPNKILILDFIHFEFYDHYVLSSIQEGVSFGIAELEKVQEVFRLHYPTAPFISIAKRQHDYTISPTCFMRSGEIENMIALGTICYSESTYQTVQFEKKFYDGVYESFLTEKEGLDWADEFMENYKKNAGL